MSTQPFAAQWHAALAEKSCPPAYDDAPSLADARIDVRRFFAAAALQLAHTPRVGVKHPLYREWQTIEERYILLERQARYNAGQCALFLTNTVSALGQQPHASPAIGDPQSAFFEILRILSVHRDAAAHIQDGLYELQAAVSAFPAKVLEAANRPAARGALGALLSLGRKRVTQPCQTGTDLVIGVSKSHLAGHATPLPFNGLTKVPTYYVLAGEKPHDVAALSPAYGVDDECARLQGALAGAEVAWRAVAEACGTLYSTVHLGSLTSSKVVRDDYLQAARPISEQVAAQLRAFAQAPQ
ncbi:hypothetical protein WOLCODRAFT_164452 [Wolfiporia cocos MD-104 SS10]|uniref:Uncharacterized protein n=1 Tax=Wolfiporia cocos (strain MD-104) TaxID=742152 RepID=A0A2H3K4W3_WOLCO|nr:hypothetical protein WOLCODRAFT_164452 [Wolfiporia cocos MD-104 SS10]